MFIERVQVDEGFLDKLDLHFVPGLNVIIGARGSGKTSLIELMRFCMGLRPFAEGPQKKFREIALAALGTGQVQVTFGPSSEGVAVTRTADEAEPRSTGRVPAVLVLGQGEIESVGLDAAGRLRLIDLFRKPRGISHEHAAEVANLRSLTVEIQDLSAELAKIDQDMSELGNVTDELSEAEAHQAGMLESVAATAEEQTRMRQLQESIAQLSVREAAFTRWSAKLRGLQERLADTHRSIPSIDEWPDAAGPEDLLANARLTLSAIFEGLNVVISLAGRLEADLKALTTDNATRRITLDDEARQIRSKLNQLQEGAGAIARTIQTLRERLGQLSALTDLRSQKVDRQHAVLQERSAILERVEEDRQLRYEGRLDVANHLNEQLGPRIRVDVRKSELDADYTTAITASLRGSGLHYSSLAPRLAERLSPRELVTSVEARDAEFIASTAEIPIDRAHRAIAFLTEHTDDLVTADIEDGIDLRLLDGTEYKSDLSTGQRCTVILPIILANHGNILLVDQPEDNLDNAFVVDTLIRAILARSTDQLIFVTHNANIPVLGAADQVIVLESDGSRAYAKHVGPLDEPSTVDAITSLMEGGLEAFRMRAEFYRRFRD
ncbi:MAG: AAA family ATPase [Dehalococcoidia bacterium]